MNAEAHWLNDKLAVRFDDLLGQIHELLATEMIRGTATPRVVEAEQKLHDLRNEFASLTGLGFRFAVCEGELVGS